MSNCNGPPDFRRIAASEAWRAYRSVQVLLASRLRVQRYGGLRHHARKHMKKVVVFVKTGHFSAFPLCKPYGKRPFSGISEGFSGLPGAFRRKNGGRLSENYTIQYWNLTICKFTDDADLWNGLFLTTTGTTFPDVVLVVVLFLTTTGTTSDNLIFCCQCCLSCLGCRFIFDNNRDNFGQLDFLLSMLS